MIYSQVARDFLSVTRVLLIGNFVATDELHGLCFSLASRRHADISARQAANDPSGTRSGTRSGIAIRPRIARPVPSRTPITTSRTHCQLVGRRASRPTATATPRHRMRAAAQESES